MTTLIPGVLYVLFNHFEELQVRHMQLTQWASRNEAIECTHLDFKLWIEQPLALCAASLLLAARVFRWVFLFRLGFGIVWYYPVILLVVCLGTAKIGVTSIRMSSGLRMASLLGFIAMPVLGVAMWLSV